MQRLKTFSLVACAVLMGFVGSRAAGVVSAHGGDPIQIHGCLNPGNGTIYVEARMAIRSSLLVALAARVLWKSAEAGH
jgi:hypothetical protein